MSDFARRIVKPYPALFTCITLLVLASMAIAPDITLYALPDEFRWHDELVSAFARFRFWTGDHVFNGAVVGKDGWIFHTGGSSLRDYQCTVRFGKKDLKRLRRQMDEFDSAMAHQGRTFLLVIAPDKSTVYPQHMPDEIPILGTECAVDQFMQEMGQPGALDILDLRTELIRQSATQQTYYKTDTHWNELGAYYAYAEIARALSARYPELQPHPLSDFDVKVVPGGRATDLPRIMGQLPIRDDDLIFTPRFSSPISTSYETLPNGLQMRVSVNQTEGLPSLLIVGDSFYTFLHKFLELGFGRVTMVSHDSLFAARMGLDDLIRQRDPDIVIVERVERELSLLYPLFDRAERGGFNP